MEKSIATDTYLRNKAKKSGNLLAAGVGLDCGVKRIRELMEKKGVDKAAAAEEARKKAHEMEIKKAHAIVAAKDIHDSAVLKAFTDGANHDVTTFSGEELKAMVKYLRLEPTPNEYVVQNPSIGTTLP